MGLGRDKPELAGAPAAFRMAAGMIARNWRAGSLTLVLPDGRRLDVAGAAPGPAACLVVHDYRFVRRLMAAGVGSPGTELEFAL